ncbi:MAG: DHH family phosphoesterase [Phycisphaerae bacterium]|nr:DHH family phosphoesterase [Phycisphaerae bacterium]
MAISNDQWIRAGQMLKKWHRPLLVAHARPDGDSLGSLIAMRRFCRSWGADATAILSDAPPARYETWIRTEPFTRWPATQAADAADGIVVLDTCTWTQLEPIAEFLRASALPRIVVDHHKTRETLVGADQEATVPQAYLIDETASAAALLVHEWARAMGWLDNADIETADALFIGMATDTGWFRFSNTDARTLSAAAELLDRGVQPDRWYTAIYDRSTPARVRLKAAMLATLDMDADDRLASAILTQDAFAQAGATQADTEDLVQELQELADVVASTLLIEQPDGQIRLNLRSKAPYVCGHDVDVAAIARTFGGGGHARAAGARMPGPIAEARSRVLAALRAALAAAGPTHT